MKPGHLLTELQRRHVLRVVGAYAVIAWVTVEVYTTIQPILWPAHEWTTRYVVMLVLAGFPVAFVLAWIFDITPQGVRRTDALVPSDAPVELVREQRPPARVVLSPRATGFFGLGILVALVGFAAYSGYRGESTARNIRSVAVLPFDDMSSTRDQEFFSDGIAEEVLNRLTQIEDLKVAPRTSSFALSKNGMDVPEIGRRLNVQAVLEGSVRRENNRVRVTARLSNAATGFEIWSETFEGTADDVFALQDDIANGIARELRTHMSARAEAGERGTTSGRAYELYLFGMSRWHSRTDRDLRQALGYFAQAIEEDPQFALAHAALAQTYAVLPAFGSYPVDTAVTRGYAAAAQAIGIDPSLSSAYAAMGQIVQNFEWDPRGAERHYQRALEYSNDETAHQWYAETLMLLGRYRDAETHVNRVLSTSSLSPVAMHVDAFLKAVRGNVPDALVAWRDLLQAHPDFELGLLGHAYTAIAAGTPAEAAPSVKRLGTLTPAHAQMYQSVADALVNPRVRAQALQALRATGDIAFSERAVWQLALGDTAGAVASLERGFEQHTDVNLPFVLVHPVMKDLRSHPSISRMISEIGLGFGR